MAKTQIFTYDNLVLYDQLLKGHISSEDAKSLKTVAIDGNTLKFYRVTEPVGDTAPAYTITLPETDLSGLIPKLTNATAGNIVTAKADGTVEDSGIKATDVATKSEVAAVDNKANANKNAIDAINNESTGILAQAKTYAKSQADGKDAAIAAAKKAGDDAQADVDTLTEKVGAVTDGKTVVQMIADAQAAATYDDTQVKANIKSNADAITKLNGDESVTGSVAKAVKDAKETLMTEINKKATSATTLSGYGITDAYTKSETDSAISTAVANSQHLKREIVSALPEVSSADAHTIYMVSKVDGSGDQKYDEYMLISGTFEKIGDSAVDLTNYATKTEVATAKTEAIATAGTNADTKISDKVGAIGDVTVKEYVDTAKSNAISTAASDATEKANKALENAKTYADGLNTTMGNRVSSLEGLVGEGFEAIPTNTIRGLFNA